MIRVTEVLDFFPEPKLVEWKMEVGKKEASRISKLAMKTGTRVDKLIKESKGPSIAKDSIEVINCFNAWKQFVKDHDIQNFEVGKRFFIEEEGITGEPDILLPQLTDIKCATRIRDKNWIQLCKYHQGAKSEMDEVCILRLDPNCGLYEFVSSKQIGLDIAYGIQVFDALFTAYKYFNRAYKEASCQS